MGFRVTPEMAKRVGEDKVAEWRKFAAAIGCVVVNDNATCTAKQKKLLEQKWRELCQSS